MQQNRASIKLDISLFFSEKLIDQLHLIFKHILSSQFNIPRLSRQTTIQTIHTGSEDNLPEFLKLAKALPNLPIYTDGKNPAIDQLLTKI